MRNITDGTERPYHLCMSFDIERNRITGCFIQDGGWKTCMSEKHAFRDEQYMNFDCLQV